MTTRRFFAASALTAAIGLAVVAQAVPAAAEGDMEKCYGINAVAKNDCASGAHSCAGTATEANDPASFVLVPAGTCEKIDGGSLESA